MVGNWCLEEKAEVAQDGAKRLTINFNARKQLTQNDHIVHKRNSKERIFADVVWADCVGSTHEDLGRILVKSSLTVTNKWVILNDDLMINFVSNIARRFFWLGHSGVARVKNSVALDGIVQYASLRDLLWLEALVLLKVLAIVVAKMVVRHNGSNTDARTNQKVAHNSLESGLSWFEIRTGNVAAVFGG
jgi:hypothetical protein